MNAPVRKGSRVERPARPSTPRFRTRCLPGFGTRTFCARRPGASGLGTMRPPTFLRTERSGISRPGTRPRTGKSSATTTLHPTTACSAAARSPARSVSFLVLSRREPVSVLPLAAFGKNGYPASSNRRLDRALRLRNRERSPCRKCAHVPGPLPLDCRSCPVGDRADSTLIEDVPVNAFFLRFAPARGNVCRHRTMGTWNHSVSFPRCPYCNFLTISITRTGSFHERTMLSHIMATRASSPGFSISPVSCQ